jgi:hypothetical protein
MPTRTPKSSETLTVVLPVCPKCRRVGKIPAGYFGGKEYCSGPMANGHKKVRMEKRTFELVEEGS